MNLAFRILGWISLLGLVVGLVKPNIFRLIFKNHTNRKVTSLCFGFLFILFIALFNLTLPKTQHQTSSTTASSSVGQVFVGIFAILLLFSLIALVAGLIKPALFAKVLKQHTNRKFVGLVFGASIVLCVVLISVIPSKQNSTSTTAVIKPDHTPVKLPPPAKPTDHENGNWAGYLEAGVTSQDMNSMSGEWTIPTVTPVSSTAYGLASTWIGIGGFGGTQTLVQIGTNEYSGPNLGASGTFYYPFWECYPQLATPIADFKVKPGDDMTSSIAKQGNDWTLTLTDKTNGGSFQKTLACSPDQQTAEWVLEGVAPGGQKIETSIMPQVTTTQFSNMLVNGHAPRPISLLKLIMQRDGKTVAAPSDLTTGNTAFTVGNVSK